MTAVYTLLTVVFTYLALAGPWNTEAETTGFNPEICLLQKESGPCFAAFPRYYYDRNSKTCSEFIYGGCQGNANNFETFEECLAQCNPGFKTDRLISEDQYKNLKGKQSPDPEICLLEKESGPCFGAFPRYYYDQSRKTCSEFIYGGCQGNANNFETLDECLAQCNPGFTDTLISADQYKGIRPKRTLDSSCPKPCDVKESCQEVTPCLGCKTVSRCVPNNKSCVKKKCSKGKYCVLLEAKCKKAPCSAFPTCIKSPTSRYG